MNSGEQLRAGVGGAVAEQLKLVGKFRATLREYDGGPIIAELDWSNLVVNVGKNAMLSAFLKTGITVGTIYMGLIGGSSPTIVAGDTMTSHSGWTESTTFGATRGTVTFGTASGGSLAGTIPAFTSTGSDTIYGAFIVQGGTSAEGNTTGTLFSAGTFGTAQPWISGNTLTVSYTISV